MTMFRASICSILLALAAAPSIAQSNQQPDKVLYDSAISDIQHKHLERARLTLQTLINTYESSEYIPRAKLAVADSWYREGGTRGLAQAEAECKDLIKVFPNTPPAKDAEHLLGKIEDKRAGKK